MGRADRQPLVGLGKVELQLDNVEGHTRNPTTGAGYGLVHNENLVRERESRAATAAGSSDPKVDGALPSRPVILTNPGPAMQGVG
ncbi:hypothetical protein GCM10009534_23520 [Kribbella sandramycini]